MELSVKKRCVQLLYEKNNLLRLAKRYQNAKRSYLLVNPLQAKHLAVAPSEALTMMEALGKLLVQKHSDTELIIGFAETATAIALHAAMQFPEQTAFLHTTRENPDGEYLYFEEEHSHAVEQKLYLPVTSHANKVILIDDEISTGKTMQNMISQIRQKRSGFTDSEFIGASVLNRVENSDNMYYEFLCKLTEQDYTQQVQSFAVTAPVQIVPKRNYDYTVMRTINILPESRKLHTVREYQLAYQNFTDEVFAKLESDLNVDNNILVLGTEECMYPALRLGYALEQNGFAVRCHATTRSPIGICQDTDYPIQNGYALPSFYDAQRQTYLYNISETTNVVLVVTDSQMNCIPAMRALASLFPDAKKILIKG